VFKIKTIKESPIAFRTFESIFTANESKFFILMTENVLCFRICIPPDYMKFELPEEGEPTEVSIGKKIANCFFSNWPLIGRSYHAKTMLVD